MKSLVSTPLLCCAVVLGPALFAVRGNVHAASNAAPKIAFHTSDRCVACHNGLKTKSGEDISIGFDWRASIMANSSRDPYWQGSVRRETLDHPESSAAVQDECSTCHMPMRHLIDRADAHKTEVFAQFPLTSAHKSAGEAADGVSCSVCHQIAKTGLGTPETYNGNVAIAVPSAKDQHLEYGPFFPDEGHRRVMQSSTGGFVPTQADHIRDSSLCGSCHTLKTKALGPGGQEVGSLPEQMPYLEYLHSDYPARSTCQSCHMPEVHEAVAITALYGQPREGMHRHDFVGANFFMEQILNDHRDDLGVKALPHEMASMTDRTVDFVRTQTARVTIPAAQTTGSRLAFSVQVENLTGHKFPTAYPSRRAWLHVVVRDRNGNAVFESGALNADGSIVGNDNDADPTRFEPHYREIVSPDQVQIFEPILKDSHGRVTTGLLSAVGYLKDNRILPGGFDKQTAEPDIAVVGDAVSDPDFTGKGALTRYAIDTHGAAGPFQIEVELWYQPIGFRWAHNLAPYKAEEPQRFVGYYEQASRHSAMLVTKEEKVVE